MDVFQILFQENQKFTHNFTSFLKRSLKLIVINLLLCGILFKLSKKSFL